MNDLILSKLDAGKSSLGITPNAHGGGIPAACLSTSVDKVGGVIQTTILVDLGQGAGSGGGANDIIGTDNTTDAGGAYIAYLTKEVNGVPFSVELSCIETPTGGDPDVNVVTGSASTDVHDAAVTGANVCVNGGDQADGAHAQGDPGDTVTDGAIALPYVYLTTGDATDAAYTAGKLIITIYGANF